MKSTSLIRPHMPELDSVRGIAVLGVLIVHAFVFKFGYEDFSGFLRLFMRATAMGKLGVNLFFVLSGFLITGILVVSRESPSYYKPFYWKRVCRILPAYLMTIVVVLIRTGAWKSAIASTFFLANVSVLFGVPTAFGPLWSLAVEEHYYLIWPTVVRHFSKIAIVFVAILLVVAAPTLRYFQAVHDWPASSATWFQCDGLAAGALLRLALSHWPDRMRWKFASAGLMFSGVAGILVLVKFHVIESASAVGNALQISCWTVVFSGFIVFVLILGSGRFQRFSNPGPLAFLGYISYSLYLYHLVIYSLFDSFFPNVAMFKRFAIVAPLSIFVAWISRVYFEEYFLRKKQLVATPKALSASA